MDAGQPLETRVARLMTWMAMILVLATDVGYILIIRGQGDVAPDAYTVPFVASYLVVMAALLITSVWNPARRMPLRAAAAGGLLVLGVLAGFSIGLPLLVAGGLSAAAAVSSARHLQITRQSLTAVASAVVAVIVLVVGFEITQRTIVCPASGSSGGGGTGFLTGPYYYDCVNGQLTYHSGSCSSSAIDQNGNVTHPGC